jgi:hypothetical protein
MKYLMLICWDSEKIDATTEPDPSDTADKDFFRWLEDLQARGIWVSGDQLAPPRRARSIRVRDGETIVTDGPFAETKEAVGGFDIIECAASRRPSRSRRDTPAPRRGRSRSGPSIPPDEVEEGLPQASAGPSQFPGQFLTGQS